MLPKGVYPYEYMDSWENFNEKSFPKIDDFYSSFKMENITGADHSYVKKV